MGRTGEGAGGRGRRGERERAVETTSLGCRGRPDCPVFVHCAERANKCVVCHAKQLSQ